MALQTINPATEEIIKTFDEITDEALEAKLQKADDAFKKWRMTSYSERAALMKKLAVYLREHEATFSALQTLEMGKTIASGKGGIEKCAAVCDYYADNAEQFLADEILDDAFADEERLVSYHPLGPVLAVMPWNFPFWQVYRFAAPAIMAGNVGLLKHASNVPQCAALIEKSFVDCGFPEGVFQNLAIGSPRVEKVIRDRRVAAVTLTGSEKAGASVASIAGSEIKKSVLELGGTDPFIVFPDADMNTVIENAVYARLQDNTGQSCIAAKRFMVHADILDQFVTALKEKLSTLVVGDPSDLSTAVGPLATKSGLEEVEAQVQGSIEKGAVCVLGGARKEGTGYYYMPTILTGVKKGMPAYDEEVFGPVFSIISFTTDDEAIHMANENPYGLGSAVFTHDEHRITRFIRDIEAGSVFINRFVKSDIRMPFGGVKKSGFGRELGSHGIKEFVNVKNICIK